MSSAGIPNTSGIYRIVCLATGKPYIGSAINLANRCRLHFHHLRQNKHHSITLQRAWDKHGEESFVFEVLELVLPAFLIEREQHWLDTFKPFGENGYNINPVAGSRLGASVSPESREKLRLANLGKTYSEETKRKHSEAGLKRVQTQATREKVRQIRLGTKRSLETRERLRTSHLGQKQSTETIKKRSLALTGRPVSDETRERISAANIAHPTHVKRMKTLIVTSPDGETFTIHGIGQFCKEHDLNRSALSQVAKGNARHHKGWTARYP